MREGGPDGLRALRDLGKTPRAEDYGPSLRWEAPVWQLYTRLATQVRLGPMGPVGLDYAAAYPLIERYGWDLETVLDLLARIEGEAFRPAQ